MALSDGRLPLGRIFKVPVVVHWTIVFAPWVFSGFTFDPTRWLFVLGLILIHELGHAAVVKAVGAQAEQIELSGFGGLCRWSGTVTPIGRAAIAWGGVWAQLVVLLAALAFTATGGRATEPWLRQLLSVATMSNVYLIALNLVPIAPLDGSQAWPLPWLLGRETRRRLTGWRNPTRAPAPLVDDGDPEDPRMLEAKRISAQLLDKARDDS